MSQTFIFSCCHASNIIPEEYNYLFQGKEDVLYSHKAFDPGALRIAKHVSSTINVPLYYTTFSRLLVEGNRAPGDEELFSEYVKHEPEIVKNDIMEKYYWPHHKRVEDEISKLNSEGRQVIHIALHTFAPVVDGEVRKTDIGLLFHPDRKWEQSFAEDLKKEILKQNPNRQVDLNLPYPGTNESYPNRLRELFSQDKYLGFEIEVNQKYYLTGEPEVWKKVIDEVTRAISAITTKTSPEISLKLEIESEERSSLQ